MGCECIGAVCSVDKIFTVAESLLVKYRAELDFAETLVDVENIAKCNGQVEAIETLFDIMEWQHG